MKLSKKLNVSLLVLLFLLPLINFAAASKTPGYVGINKDDTYVWLIQVNSKPLEGYYEDLGLSEDAAERQAEDIDDMEDIEAIRYTIRDFEEEDEYGHFDGVEVSYDYYESQNYAGNKWKLKEQDEETIIFQYDEDIYKELVSTFSGIGLLVVFVATNVNWYYVAKETKNDWEDDYDDDADYKVIEEENGLSTEFEWDDDDVDKHESITLYTSTGVLEYYEWKYDGKVIIEMNLEMSFFSEYWFVLLVLAVAAVVLVVVIFVIVMHGRKNMSPI